MERDKKFAMSAPLLA